MLPIFLNMLIFKLIASCALMHQKNAGCQFVLKCKDLFGEKMHEIDDEFNAPTTWQVWEKTESGRLQKHNLEGMTSDLTKYLLTMFPSYIEHVYIKREQAKSYKKERDIAGSSDFLKNECLLQVDFSENYTCIAQDEVQSAHWQQAQISLFTAAMWHSGMLHSYVIVSDNLTHSKDTIIAYLDRLFDEIPAEITEVSIWSDGPSSQFKNKYVAASLPVLETKHQKHIRWNYFATSHGKGPVDGIGGALKRLVWRKVQSRSSCVYNAKQFITAAKDSTSIALIEMSSDHIMQRNESMRIQSVFDTCDAVLGIKRCHFIQHLVADDYIQTCLVTKNANQNRLVEANGPIHVDNTESDPQIDDWYEVQYNGQLYYGTIIEVSNQGDFKVKVMERIGKYWKWPQKMDAIFYARDQLIRKLSIPVIINNREHYNFN